MNIKPDTKRILCFGDSLTYGSDHINNTRLDANTRWTGVLQRMLGDNYELIEEGLGGRTTDIDDPKREGRNGLSYFIGAIASHVPLELVILFVGTNDLKAKFNRTAQLIAASFEKYDQAIKVACDKWSFKYPKVLLISPPLINEARIPVDWGFVGAGEKSKLLAEEYKKMADKLGFSFLDLGPIAKPCEFDGTHLEPEENKKIAEAIYDRVMNNL